MRPALFKTILIMFFACGKPAAEGIDFGPDADWLLNPKQYKARVEAPGPDTLILTNGIIRRKFVLAPNAATVELDNPLTGKSVLRAVKPEAVVTLDGRQYAVGGLIGQPCKNYLTEEMLARMDSDPRAYQFSRWEELPVVKRFDWKRHPEWISREVKWPPSGKHIVMHYRPPRAPAERLSGKILFKDTFSGALREGWKVHLTKSDPRASFCHEGKAGEIFAPPNTCVYIERKWPEGARTVEVELDCGDDRVANSWGPGLALVAGKETVSLVLRPASRRFEAHAPCFPEILKGHFDREKPVTLRMRMLGHVVRLEAIPEGCPLQVVAVLPLHGEPELLRVGKVGKRGAGVDNRGRQSAPRRSHVLSVLIRGPEPRTGPPRSDLPSIDIHYEIYDGIPALSKWITLRNTTQKTLRLDRFSAEILATVETAPKIEEGWTRAIRNSGLVPPDQRLLDHPDYLKNQVEAPRDYLDRFMDLFVVTDYAFGGEMEPQKDNPGVWWKLDPEYERTGIRYYGLYQPTLLECAPLFGPALDLPPGAEWESFHVFELLRDSTDRRRRGLEECRFWETLAPWTCENPIYMHITFSDPGRIKAAIDQCADVGFEMVILSFGSGFNPLSTDPAYRKKMKDLVDYAKGKGIVLGGYSLLASRGGKDRDVCISKHTGKRARRRYEGSHFGPSPCLCSAWGLNYFRRMRSFYADVGAGALEHDGSYPGDPCASTRHPGHRDFYDSQWMQWVQIRDFYRWCRGRGIYLLVPDWYFLNGSNKEPMGYVETNWSLPREYQQIITRQNIYDGTFVKSPTMGYMFVPLTQYHGGGAAATVEPLCEHLDHYETQLASLFGAGVQACYRGPRLYDTEKTRAVVKKWVDFYKKNRAILDSDLVHLRRANGRGWDGWLHVNPALEVCGLAMLYNPLDKAFSGTIPLPLYYTGLQGRAKLTIKHDFDSDATDRTEVVALDGCARARVRVTIPAKGRVAIFVRAAKPSTPKDAPSPRR